MNIFFHLSRHTHQHRLELHDFNFVFTSEGTPLNTDWNFFTAEGGASTRAKKKRSNGKKKAMEKKEEKQWHTDLVLPLGCDSNTPCAIRRATPPRNPRRTPPSSGGGWIDPKSVGPSRYGSGKCGAGSLCAAAAASSSWGGRGASGGGGS